MTSLWLESRTETEPAPLHSVDFSASPDVVIVGAGLTGLVCGLECARAGVSVTLLDAFGVAELTTGLTTAKASCLQGKKLTEISKTHDMDTVREYAAVNQSALAWLREFCAESGVDVQTRAAYSIAQDASTLPAVEQEAEVARAAGLAVESARGAPFDFAPFPIAGFVSLNEQAQFDPVSVALALAEEIRARGGQIYEGIRVLGVSTSGSAVVHTTGGDITTDRVVLATGTPILDRGGFFAKLEPERSYLTAYAVPSEALQPEGMYISIDEPDIAPTRSLRSAPGHLLVGGNGHVVGRSSNTRANVRDLITWTGHYFPEVAPTHQWSAQDYSSVDGLPVAGALTPTNSTVLFASGYAKWGMTNGVAAARILAARLTGRSAPGEDLFDSQRSMAVRHFPSFAALNAKVGLNVGKSWAKIARSLPQPPAEGDGEVHHDGLRPVATSTVDGQTRTVSAVCPHLKGVLCWNSAERSWDCPLHGSRFAPDGTLLEGPATQDLAQSSTPNWKGAVNR
ncbi:FAD-dependent oxidoreductase [Hoyosella sp. YIM 151337]|uniref:FAD-dependent oxidoreductase n=1 Tax=Hoyosella sp. YIM 151337 TaxID=2992742 RepID=UPI0022361F79|nr:FAD-dependent oxidoreductase [Hoyosella sp. YIM 151337]MCW4355516.1 FAD-dependent oxidoreductase [Hoyosella sp. YIM 151337]